MLVAKKKRKENIAEYILYMFQVEDLIRAFGFDREKIEHFVAVQYTSSGDEQKEIIEWYNNLALMMEKEGVKEKGHVQFLLNLINDLDGLHIKLIQSGGHPGYVNSFKTVSGLIQEFNKKAEVKTGDIATCINALYMYLMLKLQKKDISAETTDAMKQFGKLLSDVSVFYKDFEKGNLEL